MNRSPPLPDAALRKKYRVRIVVFLLAVLVFLTVSSTIVKGINTIQRLAVVEAERDRWQKASEVIAALSLKQGDVVADVGSGAGYFALKLSHAVGSSGKVFAMDVRKLPLTFLWIRAFFRGAHNVKVLLGEPDDPRLPANSVDAVLIANTYHEFANPELMLDRLSRALRPGGRLVVLDRAGTPDSHEERERHHDLPPGVVEVQLRKKRFDIPERRDDFIDRPGGDRWWIIVARKH